jgi:hypothetical protein
MDLLFYQSKDTLFTPDILDEPTPIVPFQQSTSHFYQGAL